MAGQQDVGAGTVGPCTRGSNVSGYGYARIQDCLDDIAHRRDQAAGCIDVDDDECRASIFGVFDAADNVVGGCNADAAIDLQFNDLAGGPRKLG